MKKIINILAVLILLFSLQGCSDLFDKNPLSQPSDGTFWTNENDAYMVLTGCYNVGGSWRSQCFWNPDGVIYLDIMAGNGSEKESRTDGVTNGELNSNNWVTEAYYDQAYEKIARCNNFLEHIVDVDMDADKKAEFIGEIRTIRAYAYLNLALYFGDVPLSTKNLTLEEANSITRTSQSEVWNFAANELEAAAADLPWTRSNNENGRITAGAALASLGRIQMAQNKWDAAVSTYKKIIDSQAHIIERVPLVELFYATNEFSREFIYTTQYTEDTYPHVFQVYIFPEKWGGWHQYSPYNEFVKDFLCIDGLPIEESPLYDKDFPYENRDSRLLQTIMVDGYTQFRGDTYISYPGSGAPDDVSKYIQWSGYSIRKFMDPEMNSDMYNSGNNFSLIRYAEVLLSYLESKLEAGDAIDQALLDLTINPIRQRVGMPDVTETNRDKLREIVRRERRIELAFEGVRYFDVLRWGIIADELENRQFTGMKVATSKTTNTTSYEVDEEGYIIYKKTNFKRGINELWPIPLSEIEINPNLIQNSGY
ncbi:MAG: RagB/SusD family nutrient uptake outer membrane protein [Tannerellaceae bacterium]|jgi:tetratricopeptide (TPR) repeat protein|nr:RagB/SusD family nutrient uptake outer membrane protein [Tannerellaceae bacterium]